MRHQFKHLNTYFVLKVFIGRLKQININPPFGISRPERLKETNINLARFIQHHLCRKQPERTIFFLLK